MNSSVDLKTSSKEARGIVTNLESLHNYNESLTTTDYAQALEDFKRFTDLVEKLSEEKELHF